jgi:uncharacterized protein (DUF3084 family)
VPPSVLSGARKTCRLRAQVRSQNKQLAAAGAQAEQHHRRLAEQHAQLQQETQALVEMHEVRWTSAAASPQCPLNRAAGPLGTCAASLHACSV